MQPARDTRERRKPANLTINADLLLRARALNINLSATLERALIEEVGRVQRELWLKENKEAIAAYNADVELRGVFSEGIRSF